MLQELDDLGSGFRVGRSRHGDPRRRQPARAGSSRATSAAVGFDLFMQMMEEATQGAARRGRGPVVEPEIEARAGGLPPGDYIPDIGERLLMYKRLANAESHEALDALADEIADRFGALPEPAEDFLRVMALRPALKRLAIESLKANEGTVVLRFHPESRSIATG